VNEQSWGELVARLDRRLRRFPVGSRCAECTIGHPLLLTKVGRKVLCHDCRLKRRGLRPFELHHLGGDGGPTVEVPANLHVLLTVLQGLWCGHLKPGSAEAQLFDLLMLRTIGPLFGIEA
jgi:hypothetical protein